MAKNADHRDAFLFALDKGIAEPPTSSSWSFFNACVLSGLEEYWRDAFVCEQHNRVAFNALTKAGYDCYPKLENSAKTFDGAVVFLGRNRLLNEQTIKRAWNSCRDNGRLVIVGAKTEGINSIRKWFGTQAAICDSISKFHSVVFWADKNSSDFEIPNLTKKIEGYQLSDGMFSADGPDAGSMVLVEMFSDRIRGNVADFGSGWGFLSAELLKQSDRIGKIDLFEADWHSVKASEINLSNSSAEITFNWIDVTSEFRKKPYDWVIMNPPFHSGRSAQPELGKRFIEVASSTLPRGGKLLMVANQNLPYEKTIGDKFRRSEKLIERDGFKVIEAVK